MKPLTFIFRGNLAQFRERADTATAWDDKWSRVDITKQLHLAERGDLGVYRRGFRDFLPQNGLILDAGCGIGRYVMALRKKEYNVLGLDWAQQTLFNAKKSWSCAPFIIGEMNHLPLPTASLAAVISLGVIEHFVQPWILLKDFIRVLKPGGILYLAVPYENRLRKYGRNKGKYPHRDSPSDFYQYLFDRNEIEAQLTRLDFSVINRFSTSGYAGLVDEWKNLDRLVQLFPFSHHLINYLNRSRVLGSISGHIIHVICRKLTLD